MHIGNTNIISYPKICIMYDARALRRSAPENNIILFIRRVLTNRCNEMFVCVRQVDDGK